MTLFVLIVILLLGFVILVKSSTFFVDAISSLAINFKMSKMAIAMTVGAFSTCVPELAISFNSMIASASDIVISNVLGSSIVNILLIIGLAAFCFPIKTKETVLKKEALILVSITALFAFSMIHNMIYLKNNVILTRVNALLLLLMFGVFIIFIISEIKIKKGFFENEKAKYTPKASIIISIFSIIGVLVGSNIIVNNATNIANMLGISEKLITMTVIVVGTSLPELFMTVVSAKKKEYDLAIGNIVGTNIFNIGIVLGLPILIFGDISSASFNYIDLSVALIASILFYIFAKSDKKITRIEGCIMVVLFVLYYIYLFLQ
ncbi:MAG: calcium/sodium antiporter [bacterium]|nr:calcium/sodium antiporter [bacterium]